MREFILLDLRTQMPYLPVEMREWPHERVLDWMLQYGEVRELETWRMPGQHGFVFRSWLGLSTPFVLTDDGDMFIPGARIHAWRRGSTSDDVSVGREGEA